MPRAATTSDTFNAIAEPRRRDILDYLAPRERPVGDIVIALGLAQPPVSKPLRVLPHGGLVDVRRDGRQVFYRTNAEGIRPLHEWTSGFERYWRNQLRRVKERAERNRDTLTNRLEEAIMTAIAPAIDNLSLNITEEIH